MHIAVGRRLHRLVLAALLAITAVQVFPIPIHAYAHGNTPPDIDPIIHAAAAYRHVSYWQMRDVLECESNHWDRRVINGTKLGRDRERGIAQILPSWEPAAKKYGSLGALFESRTGDYSASDSIYFMAWAFSQGLRWHWHC
jgi:hypothetical protein